MMVKNLFFYTIVSQSIDTFIDTNVFFIYRRLRPAIGT